jgi:DNA mismatch repair ATPase MutS
MRLYFGYALLIILIAMLISLYGYMKKLRVLKIEIVEKYGKAINIKETKIDFKYVSSYFKNRREKTAFHIDDITWNDLDMDEVFLSMNNTNTSIGEEVLYDILREPLFDENKLKDRDELIEYFQNNEKDRLEVQYILGKLGKNQKACLSDYFYNPEVNNTKNLGYYRILAALPIVTTALCFFNIAAIILVFASVIANYRIHQSVQMKAAYKLDDYMYIISLVNCCKKISELNIKVLEDKHPEINSSINNVKSIRNQFVNMVSSGAMNEAMIMSEYTKILFLTEVRKYEKIGKTIKENSKDFINIYSFIGTMDSLISIASYRNTLVYYSKPNLEKVMDIEKNHLSFKDIYHPLIKNPVANSCDLTQSILLTGSNASGKSTFLKTIAINSITAQTIYTTFTKEYISSFFRLYTSMALKDNIFNNESYFIVEIKSLKRIIDNLNDEVPCLCFIDEILRGTNTIERISASSEVLNYFSNSNCICVAATHDVELTHILEKNFANYHFQESIENNEIILIVN